MLTNTNTHTIRFLSRAMVQPGATATAVGLPLVMAVKVMIAEMITAKMGFWSPILGAHDHRN